MKTASIVAAALLAVGSDAAPSVSSSPLQCLAERKMTASAVVYFHALG